VIHADCRACQSKGDLLAILRARIVDQSLLFCLQLPGAATGSRRSLPNQPAAQPILS